MLISTTAAVSISGHRLKFQSLDWVDVDFDKYLAARGRTLEGVSIPRLG